MTWDSTGCAIYSERVRKEEAVGQVINNPTDSVIYERELEKFSRWKQRVSDGSVRGNIYARPPRPPQKANSRGWESDYRFPANNDRKTMMRVTQNIKIAEEKLKAQQLAQAEWDRALGGRPATMAYPSGSQTTRPLQSFLRREGPSDSTMAPFFVYPDPATLRSYAEFAQKNKIQPHPPVNQTEGGRVAYEAGYFNGTPPIGGPFCVQSLRGEAVTAKMKGYYEYLEAQDKMNTEARELALYKHPGEIRYRRVPDMTTIRNRLDR